MSTIEPTDEMRAAFLADNDTCVSPGCGKPECLDQRLAAVLAIVERDYEVTPYREGDWTDRQCDGCGRSVAARSKTARVLCVVCHPADLPL